MALKILFFGKLSDRFGDNISMELPDGISCLSGLTGWLEKTHGAENILNDKSVRIMVNHSIANGDIDLSGDEEIGYLPPVGGG